MVTYIPRFSGAAAVFLEVVVCSYYLYSVIRDGVLGRVFAYMVSTPVFII